MKLIETNYKSSVLKEAITPFGHIYFFNNYIVSEAKEGVNLDWNFFQETLKIITNYYGTNRKISLISNRVNNYSVVPTIWLDFYRKNPNNILKSMSFVTYTKLAYSNARLESSFFNCKTECFTNLEEAINWTENLTPFISKQI
ncbi:hypothetical protein [Oceanihabitans sediminis]|uniref:STAS/SEC14 domain-containing protein n=1 Tax=Oceanihabitans sediminis TaxID=1812012 RepID=A0A368P5Q5_9FLAO|nr:hypothetical protein [Oceanihabitans sediminis]MDX1277922.1 hypothetical protein [Oceanihabitans sediminis]MDX1773394.1 hypothetical protein [Oceanihabitans sediminis]RBP32850.1 hypothetical protein DFR65_102186 [Oceanihabitans sediminis]RCU57620.1 hypothetical protein DU428_07450 [Oceanihabitans sediminis]